MLIRLLALSIAFLMSSLWARGHAEEPPAAVTEDEAATPIADEAEATQPADESEAALDSDALESDSTEESEAESEAKTETPDVNAGLDDLDKATQLKVTAESLPDLNDVVDKLDSALERGLDKDNQAFAEQLLISALLQRATLLSAVILDRPVADPRRDPRWMQVRQFALNDLHRVMLLDDKIWEAHLLSGRLQVLPNGDEKTAKREFTLVIDAPEAAVEDRAQALALRGTLQTDEAKRAADFDRAVELVPDKPDYYRIRAQYRYGQDKFDEAIADVDKAIELEEDHAGTHELRGLILVGLEKTDDALAAFNKSSELAPESVRPHQQLGEVYRQKGDLKKASEQLTKALELAPGDPATLLLRANVLVQLGDTGGALQDVEKVIQAQPQLLLAHLLKAEILASNDRMEEAIAHLEKLLPLAPDQTRLLEPLATFYLVDGRPRKSIETFSKVIELEPENSRALRFRGDANLNIGNHAEAVADFDAAVALDPEDEGLLNNFAWVLATSPDDKVRDGKRALELATKAAELSSHTVPHILSTLAAAYAETGDFESAKKWSQQAIEVSQQEVAAAKDDAARKSLEETHENLTKELANYESGKPVREIQEQEEKKSTPAANDHTSTPPAIAPDAEKTLGL